MEYLVLRTIRNQLSYAITALKGAKLHLHRIPPGLFDADMVSERNAIDHVIAVLESLKAETTEYLRQKKS